MKSNWPTKKFGIVLVVSIVIIVAIFGWLCPAYLSWLTLLVLTLTLAVLVWYAHDTYRIANESVVQTELGLKPIMCLYVRKLKEGVRDEYAITHLVGNGIVPSAYYIALRNVGNGPAFNVSLESKNFIGWKYQTRFFAPKKDEHAVKIVKRPSNKIRDLSELKGEIFVVKCQTITGKWYEYKYKVIDIEERVVEFIL